MEHIQFDLYTNYDWGSALRRHREEQQGVLPGYVQAAISKSTMCVIVTENAPPFRIVATNAAWCNQCGFTEEEAIGRLPRELLQGHLTDKHLVKQFSLDLVAKGRATMRVLNYTKSGRPFPHYVTAEALQDPHTGDVTHFIGPPGLHVM